MITTIFSDSDQAETVGRLRGDDAQTFVDVIDEVGSVLFHDERTGCLTFKPSHSVDQALDILPPEIRRKCLHYLSRICSHQTLIPGPLAIPLCYDQTRPPLARGGYADIWRGKHRGMAVAAKVLRVHRTSDLNQIKRVCRPRLVVYINRLTMCCTGVLQGSRNLEIPPSSERVAAVGRDDNRESARDGI